MSPWDNHIPALSSSGGGFFNFDIAYLLLAKVGTFEFRRWRYILVAGAGVDSWR